MAVTYYFIYMLLTRVCVLKNLRGSIRCYYVLTTRAGPNAIFKVSRTYNLFKQAISSLLQFIIQSFNFKTKFHCGLIIYKYKISTFQNFQCFQSLIFSTTIKQVKNLPSSPRISEASWAYSIMEKSLNIVLSRRRVHYLRYRDLTLTMYRRENLLTYITQDRTCDLHKEGAFMRGF